jgi:hypothetical protein
MSLEQLGAQISVVEKLVFMYECSLEADRDRENGEAFFYFDLNGFENIDPKLCGNKFCVPRRIMEAKKADLVAMKRVYEEMRVE